MLLGEEALLLVYKPDKKKIPLGGWGMFLPFVIPATILSDLKLAGKISLIGDIESRKRRMTLWVNPVDDTPTCNPILDEIYNVLKNHTKKGKRAICSAAKWMEHFGKTKKDLESRMWDSLIEKGVLKPEGKKNYILIQPEFRQEIIDRIARAVSGQEEPESRTTAITGYIENHFGWYMTDVKGRDKKLAQEIGLKEVLSFILKWNVVVKKKQNYADAVSMFSFIMGGLQQITIDQYVEANDLVLD